MMLVLLLLIPALTAVAEGGVNEQTSLEGTPISSVDNPSEASEGEPFDISVTITQEASCLLYTSPSPRDLVLSRMPSSA